MLQTTPSLPVCPLSQTHEAIAELPGKLLPEFPGHTSHFEARSLPVFAEYVPETHGKHAACPARCWYVPTPHNTQLAGSVPALPALYLPAAHSEQGSLPDDCLNEPGTQGLHVPPMFCVCPGSHWQLACAVAIVAALKELAWQVSHGWGPALVLYLPCPHAAHVPGVPEAPAPHCAVALSQSTSGSVQMLTSPTGALGSTLVAHMRALTSVDVEGQAAQSACASPTPVLTVPPVQPPLPR